MNEDLDISTEKLMYKIGLLTMERDAWKDKAELLQSELMQIKQEVQVERMIAEVQQFDNNGIKAHRG